MTNMRILPGTLRFDILYRDDFTCLYCGARPGNEKLEVDHILPWSLSGADTEENLATSCQRCNRGKLDTVKVPRSMLAFAVEDGHGWLTWKRWGRWSIRFSHWEMHIVCNDGDVGAELTEITFPIAQAHKDWEEYFRNTLDHNAVPDAPEDEPQDGPGLPPKELGLFRPIDVLRMAIRKTKVLRTNPPAAVVIDRDHRIACLDFARRIVRRPPPGTPTEVIP